MGTGHHKKKSNYIVQGGILAAASILVRIIGMVYRIPVTRILGPVGNSYYSAAYEVYSMVLLISSFQSPAGSIKTGVCPYGGRTGKERHIRFLNVR